MTGTRANTIIVASIVGAVALSAVWSWIHRPVATTAPTPMTNLPTVTDECGCIIPVRAPAKRIVSGYAAFTEILTALGTADRIVAATTRDAATLGVTSVGSHLQPDVEAILSAKPDLVLLASPRPDVAPAIEHRLMPIGAIVFSARPKSVEETLTLIEALGLLTGCQTNATRIVAGARQALQVVSNAVAAIPDERRPRVFVEARGVPSLLTARNDSVTCDMIRLAGGRPACADSGKMTPVDLESLLKADPDFYIQQVGAMNSHPDDPAQHPVIGTLRCLKAGRFAKLDEAALSRPGPQVAEVVARLHALLFAGTTNETVNGTDPLSTRTTP